MVKKMLEPQDILTDEGWGKYIGAMLNIIHAFQIIEEYSEPLKMSDEEYGIFEDAAILADKLVTPQLFENEES